MHVPAIRRLATAATERLAGRGWVAPDGTATDAGRAGRDEVEQLTDHLAAGPYRALGTGMVGRLAGLLQPITMAVGGTGLLPRQSTLGISRQ
jgi:hypothetical protein